MAVSTTGFQNIFKVPELKRRVLIALGFLAVYRIGVHIPTPGVDGAALAEFFERNRNTIFGIFDMFSGGALENFSVFALGIMPYISASIILQLLTVVFPHLERLSKEGEQGKKKITQYTRYGTIVLSIIQGFGIAIGLENMAGPGGAQVVMNPGWSFRLLTMITLTSGTAFIMWLGEQISERGIGNGMSLIIFSGIVARMPQAIGNTFQMMSTGTICHRHSSCTDGGGDRVYQFCGTGTAQNPRSVRQAGGGPAHVRGAEHAFALENQQFGRYSAHIRLILDHVPGDHCQFFQGRRFYAVYFRSLAAGRIFV
jgi:preprotein translocase subunit SecY